tara:strand:- start:82 stop:258 length:177 start_codon:yes stop_codon:yes gene_type:complete
MENLEIDKSKEKSILEILNYELKYKNPPPLKRQKAFDSNLYKITNININMNELSKMIK